MEVFVARPRIGAAAALGLGKAVLVCSVEHFGLYVRVDGNVCAGDATVGAEDLVGYTSHPKVVVVIHSVT